MKEDTAAARYDKALGRARVENLPADAPRPQPAAAWPAENLVLLERYRDWLEAAGLSADCIAHNYIPMAGHVLGLNLKPHTELDLETDLERAMDYVRAKRLSTVWTENCGHALNRFRHFLRQERGLIEVHFAGVDLSAYQAGLPDWLVEPLTRYQHLRQPNWRPARLYASISRFWSHHARLWRWLLARYPISQVSDVKRQYIFDHLDHRLAAGYAISGINQDLRSFRAFLLFLQERGQQVPQALLRIRGLKEPDRLPRFLTDEQVTQVREDLERRVVEAKTAHKMRDALLDRAAFYLLWQGGMRLGEVEELRFEDLDLSNRRLMVREGKGLKDRTVYLTDGVVQAVEVYLAVRGLGQTDHAFLYRARPLKKDLIRARVRAAGERVGVTVTPHRLRHTYATQLVNAGCRITSLQQLLGHQHINTTLVYARVHDRTVAEDYYAAMEIVEKSLEPVVNPMPACTDPIRFPGEHAHLLELLDTLQGGVFDHEQRETLRTLRQGILVLARLEAQPERVESSC